jgi:hypothetical protein
VRAGRRTRSLAAVAAAALIVAGCDAGEATDPDLADDEVEDAAPDDGDAEAPAETEGPAETETAGPDPALPDVLTIDVAEVDTAPDDAGIDGTVASAAAGLPATWKVAVVPDASLGPYVVGVPGGATVWRVGDDLGPLRDAGDGSAWLRYWEPILAEANDAVEGSSLRAAVVLGEGDADGHLTITATPIQDLPADDPETIAERFGETFSDQGLTVDEVGTDVAGDAEVAALILTTPADEFDDGVPRRLRQWFYPEVGAPILWSLTCEGPATDPGRVDATCEPLLASFRPPPR